MSATRVRPARWRSAEPTLVFFTICTHLQLYARGRNSRSVLYLHTPPAILAWVSERHPAASERAASNTAWVKTSRWPPFSTLGSVVCEVGCMIMDTVEFFCSYIM